MRRLLPPHCTPPTSEVPAADHPISYVIVKFPRRHIIRIQVSLGECKYSRAKKPAAKLGISFAELLRRALRQVLPPEGDAPWMRYAGFVESDDPLSSQTIDEVVYGRND
jgi:hypothetical protein